MSVAVVPWRPPEPQYVYAMFCELEGIGCVKVGITKNPAKRLGQLKTSCPLPIGMFAVINTGRSRRIARYCERELHRLFVDRSINGEWFRFDFACEDDKREFNDTCRDVFRRVLGDDHGWWKKVQVTTGGPEAETKKRIRRLASQSHRTREIKRIAAKREDFRKEIDEAVKKGLL